MSDEPRQALREIIAKYGTDICSDARRCEGLLKDYSGSHRRQTNILVNALKERVPLDLLATGKSMPRELILNRLAKRLEENIALTAEASNWAVESWALALNIISDSEVRERENKRAKVEAGRTTEPKIISDTELENNAQKSFDENSAPQPAARKQTPAMNKPTQINRPPIFAPQVSSPVQTPGQSLQTPISPVLIPKNSPQINQAQKPEPKIQTRRAKRSWKIRGCFTGCLLLLILLSVLIFGVPYAFKVMRETQQQSEPQFRPSQ